MRELYIEGVATRGGPESCAGVRESVGEALTGVRAGGAVEPRKHSKSGEAASKERESARYCPKSMRVEVLYFDGCPNHEALLPRLRDLVSSTGSDAHIDLVRVEDTDAAERERFLGSPSVRVDGEDIEPGAEQRTDFGLKCRLFATPDGLRGIPTDEWVLAALDRAQTPSR